MHFFSRHASTVPSIVGLTLLALCLVPVPSLAQSQILNGRDEVTLTPAQQAVVDKITRSAGTVNVGILKRIGTTDGGPPENRYAKLVLPLGSGKDITLVRTRPSVKSERGITWRGMAEDTGERAILMLWNDGHLSGYFAYKGRVFSVNHLGGDIHTMAEIELPPDHTPDAEASFYESTAPRPQPPEPKVAPFPDAERKALEAKTITIDLMLLYTKNAADHYLGEPADLLAVVIDEANETFKRSGLGNIRLRLVHTQRIDFDETGSQHFEILYAMVDGVGAFKDVRKLRNDKRRRCRTNHRQPEWMRPLDARRRGLG